MLFPKPEATKKRKAAKRKSKEEFWAHPNVVAVRNLPCVCCNRKPPSDPHHLLTRGANRGADWLNSAWNLPSLCSVHHDYIHRNGITRTAFIFVMFRNWLIKHGWDYSPATNDWSHT